MRVLRNVAIGCVSHGAVDVNRVRSDGGHAHWKFRITGGEHKWVNAVWREIAERSGAVLIIFAPPMEMFLAERGAHFYFPKPAFPIDCFLSRLCIEVLIPFAGDAVAGIPGLRPDELANLAGFD